jgi:glycosyltransferase involved in cell wall biosynthesis
VPDSLDDLVQKILLLYKNTERRAELAQGIRQFHHYHNWPDLSAQYVDLVEKLTCDKGRLGKYSGL